MNARPDPSAESARPAGASPAPDRGPQPAATAAAPSGLSPVHALYYGRHRMSLRAGTYLALIRMMGVSHLVPLLYGHTQLADQTRDRLARTRQTLRTLIDHGLDTPEGRSAVQRLRRAHDGLPAAAADYRYVLGEFFLEPLRWNAAHARHRLSAAEQALLLDFWLGVGRAMGVPDLPLDLDAWWAARADYEARHLGHTPQGERLARLCLRDVVTLTVPWGLQGAFRQLMLATMDPPVRRTLALPPAWPLAGAVLRWLAR